MSEKSNMLKKTRIITVFLMILSVTASMLFFVSCGKEKAGKEPVSDTAEEQAADKAETTEAAEIAEAPETTEPAEVAETADSSATEEIPSKTASFKLPGSEGSDKSSEAGENSNAAWAEAYHKYLVDFGRTFDGYEYSGPEYRSYDYIYVNDDDIPELVMQGQDEATGNIVLTYNNGKIDELQTSRLYFDYIEKGNLLRNSDGHMGGYYDYIYSIIDGKWKMENCGEYYVEDNSVMWDDDDLIYEWNGKKVSRSEYEKALKDIYDEKKAVPGSGVLGYEEILDKLKNSAQGIKDAFLEDSKDIHKYEVIVKDVTWKEALDDCRSRGGYLVRVNTSEERYYLEDMLKNNKQEKLVIWLGGCLNPKDGHYHWYDGEKYGQAALDKDEYYKFCWLTGEPSFTGVNADGNMTDENYMCMFQVKGYWEWNDVPEDISPFYSGKIAYICEYE